MKWDNVIAGALAEIVGEDNGRNADLCQVIQPDCRFIWQTTRPDPTTGEPIQLCWIHARVYDEHVENRGG